MGARASVSFKDQHNESPAIFSHWGGKKFHQEAKDYVHDLKKDIKDENNKLSSVYPLGRLEPSTVIVDFIRHITKKMDRVESDLYLGKTETDGDNSDYGHETIVLDSPTYQ